MFKTRGFDSYDDIKQLGRKAGENLRKAIENNPEVFQVLKTKSLTIKFINYSKLNNRNSMDPDTWTSSSEARTWTID